MNLPRQGCVRVSDCASLKVVDQGKTLKGPQGRVASTDSIMENQTEKIMEHELETRKIWSSLVMYRVYRAT